MAKKATKTTTSTKKPCKCACCGTMERVRKAGKQLLTNICATLGVCGECLFEGRA